MHLINEAQSLRERLVSRDSVVAASIDRVEHGRRVIPLSRSHHVRGWHPVRPDHGAVPFESQLECRVLTALAAFEEFRSVQSQPVTVFYEHDGRRVRYTPDFRLSLSSIPNELAALGFGHETYIEVKPLWRALGHEAKLRRQFAVLRAATACPVVLVTECDLPRMRREIRHG
jgi:hypothetical protein